MNPAIVNLHTIKPIDAELVRAYAASASASTRWRSIPSSAAWATPWPTSSSAAGVACSFKKIGVPDCFGQSGKAMEVLAEYGLTGAQIAQTIAG